jgi:hypothetical protein
MRRIYNSLEELTGSPEFPGMDQRERITAINAIMARSTIVTPQIRAPIPTPRGSGYDLLTSIARQRDEKLIVFILGAGPVGLLTAIKLVNLYKDQVRVVLFEKREIYTRERVLFVNKHIIHDVLPKQLLTKSKMASYGCSMDDLPNKDLATCNVSPDLNGIDRLAISTRVLEDDLKELLDTVEYKRQVSFVYNPDSDLEYMEDVNTRFTPHVFVGADGGNLSTKMYKNQTPDGAPIAKKIYHMRYDDGTDVESNKTTYGLVIQFTPQVGDTKFRPGVLDRRQNRYRVFRQQYRDYHKCSGDPTNCKEEPLLYYIAVQLNEAEKIQIVKELGGKEWVSGYSLGDSSPNGKYLDRLIYDASKIYNFDLRPGRFMTGVSVFALNVSSMEPENYSRIVEIRSVDGVMRQMWFPLIGDSILSVNFFSGTGLNGGFAMIDILLQSLVQLLPNKNAIKLFNDPDDPILQAQKFKGYSPEAIQYLDPEAKNALLGIGHLKMPFASVGVIQEQFNPANLKYFGSHHGTHRQAHLQEVEKLVDSYRMGLDMDLEAGSFMTEGQPGLDRILSTNIFGSYLDYSTMIQTCHSDPAELNSIGQNNAFRGIVLDEINLNNLNGKGDPNSPEQLYPKAIDRFCLMAFNTLNNL